MDDTILIMAKNKPADEGPTSPIRVSKEQAHKLRIIASIRGTTIAKLVSPHLQPFIDREYPRAMKDAPDSRR